MLRYIFDREQVTAATPDLPMASTLQRAAAAHLKSGGEWVGGVGVRAIPWVWKPEITAVPVERQQRPALVVLAAGLGSRFGGNKQLAQVGPAGETILDFTVHDAIRFGFAEVILVVRPGMEETVRGMVADRISRHIPVRLVPQACDRPRPWGTAHALACALPGLERPCGVVNADDWYNPEGIRLLAEALAASSSEGVLVSYRLGRTLSPNGPVNRAVCGINNAGFLTQVDEACGIVAGAAGPCIVNKDGTVAQQFSDDTPVSLNLWGFHTHTYAAIQMAVQRFLASDPAPTAECFLPSVVMDHIRSDGWKITTRCADADWCGLTYPADHESVCARLTQATADGLYPSPLWAAAQRAAIS
jgi:CTP:molybdopterin cytidylyltransferase MocA